MKKILQKDSKVLHKIAEEIRIVDIKTPKIQKVLKEMSESLAKESDGVAIAGPQIGYSLRIFVVSGKVFSAEFAPQGLSQADAPTHPLSPERSDGVRGGSDNIDPVAEKDMVFINPKISKMSKKKEWVPEGCLSVRPIYGKTYRSLKATVTAYDENGKKFIRGASGLLAQIFQHETDHLNGILFTDHAKDLKEEVRK